MSATPTTHSLTRLSGFAAASLWHRRMARARVQDFVTRAHPRLCAELVLHPITRERGESSFNDARKVADVFHAA